MQHKWTDEEGVKHNFCIKCGLKKSWARRRPCNVTEENWKKNLSHKLVEEYKDYYGRTISKCSVCGVEVNKRWSSYALTSLDKDDDEFPDGKVYVPYVEKKDENGKVVRRCCTTNTHYQQKKQMKAGREIKFMLIGCAYTEVEADVRDIIL